MKLTVKTLKGSHFQISVHTNDTIVALKKKIEGVQGKDNYPFGQQLLIHNGKVLKDESTLAENKVSEDGFLVVMLSKGKNLGSTGATSSQPAPATAPTSNPTAAEAPTPEPAHTSTGSSSVAPITNAPIDAYAQAASTLNSGNNLEHSVQQLMDMGGSCWDKETVTRALRAAYNNPERAVDYLYSGIPESAEIPVSLEQSALNSVAQTGTAQSVPVSGAPNSSPLNLFPQEAISGSADSGVGSLDFLRNNLQFQTLRSMVQANPQILQPMLQELGKYYESQVFDAI